MVNNYLAIGHGLYVVEIHIKSTLHESPLSQVLGDARGSVKAVLVKRDQDVIVDVKESFVLKANDIILLCGTRAELKYLAPRLV